MENTDSGKPVTPGEEVYSDDGTLLGYVSSISDEEFVVEAADGAGMDPEEVPGQEFGEGVLMWRCGECGEMGDLDDSMPDTCPNCGAPREAIAEVTED